MICILEPFLRYWKDHIIPIFIMTFTEFDAQSFNLIAVIIRDDSTEPHSWRTHTDEVI